MGAGDFWWDLTNPVYVVPNVDPAEGQIEVSATFAGALWIGGIDAGGQLKIAAQTYRQSGDEFWPGPLDEDGQTDQSTCKLYDRHWKVNRVDIDGHVYESSQQLPVPIHKISNGILHWPAKNNPYARGRANEPLPVHRNLAPFVDVDGNGEYDPTQGDYPDVDGDQAIFWVFNDEGNLHGQTESEAIGLEVHALAYAWQTGDEINDMTFYRYSFINKGIHSLDSTWLGLYSDADLGWFLDDYVGCDTTLNMGIHYNGQAVDGPGSPNYGNRPPLLGTMFLESPKQFFLGPEGLDSVSLGMTNFLFWSSDFTAVGNPEKAIDYYRFMSGRWKDNTRVTYGGNGYGGSTPTTFFFPSDPSLPSPAWSECALGIPPADRKYVQSAGPFALAPGQRQTLGIAVVWVRPEFQVGCFADFSMLRRAASKAQALFDSDFRLIDGPDAPDMNLRELDKEILLSLTNGPTSNNAGETYEEADPIIKNIVETDPTGTITDSTYNFEGYIVYQLRDSQVSPSEFTNPDRARIIAQVDLKNGVERLVNFTFDATLNADVPVLAVDGEDAGIRHTFRVLEDRFAEGNQTLVNHRTYYFSVVAYAYNNYKDYDPANPTTQKLPFLQGRQNVKSYTAIPHIIDSEIGGTVLNTAWGEGPELVRQEGKGNGGRVLEVTEESKDRILATGFDENVTYQGRFGPVDVMVADPLKIPAADFELSFTDASVSTGALAAGSSSWTLTNLTDGESVNSDQNLDFLNEQLVEKWGLAITAFQDEFFVDFGVGSRREPAFPGGISVDFDPTDPDNVPTYFERAENNGFLEATIEYESPSKAWLTGVPDGEAQSPLNWIRAGLSVEPPVDYPGIDNNQVYEGVLGGTWAPAKLVGTGVDFVPFGNIIGLQPTIQFSDLHSVDVVFTPNKDEWTRSVVVETAEEGLSIYGKSDVKNNPSVGKDGLPDGTGTGRSWFPGYAIDLETGERLNIVFGESTWLAGSNGNDMLWNPTDEFFDPLFVPRYGGKHYVYVMNTRYDLGEEFLQLMASGGTVDKRNAWNKAMWVSMPFVQSGFSLTSLAEGLIPTETRVRLRVTQPYQVFPVDNTNSGYNKYSFSTRDLAAETNVKAVAEQACLDINVVPNPYYAFSSYETGTLDNRIKFTNLPARCVISVYSLDGTLIRRLSRDVAADNTAGGSLNTSTSNLDNSLDWDLKNVVGVPISSGVYLIHVTAEGLCDRTLKWMGVMRQIDLDTF